jgi:hypothetical protein
MYIYKKDMTPNVGMKTYHSVIQCASSMTTAFRESWKAPWIKLLLQGPGVSAASGDENTIENYPGCFP